jgi:hypothetical protein
MWPHFCPYVCTPNFRIIVIVYGQGLDRRNEFQTSSPSLPRSAGICFSSRLVSLLVLMTIDGVWIGFIVPYTLNKTSGLQEIQLCRCSTHFQFIVAHALGYSVLTSRTLTTDLSQSRYHFKSHVNSSFHSLILFCPSQSPSAAISRTRPSSNSSCERFSLYSLEADP